LLSEKVEEYPFPVYKYKMYALLSIISQTKGDKEMAEQFAILADKRAAAETSGFRYHPTAGVFTESDMELDE